MFKKILNLVLSLSLLSILLPTKVFAQEDEKKTNKDGYEIVTPEQMEYELGSDSPYKGLYITYGIDEDGNIVRLNISQYQERGVVMTIAVIIGAHLVGYLITTVIEGVVIAATGQSGGEWVAEAIKRVLNQPYSSSLTIDKATVCSGYPMYGWKPDYCR